MKDSLLVGIILVIGIFVAFGAAGLVGWLEYTPALTVEEICLEIDKIQPGDVEAFRAWLGPQYTHVVNPTDVAACLFGRLPK